MASKRRSPEVEQILESLPVEALAALAKIDTDQDMKKAVRFLLSYLVTREERKVVKNSGAISSMDTMINFSINQTFSRGRISLAVLINSIIEDAPMFADKKAEKKK